MPKTPSPKKTVPKAVASRTAVSKAAASTAPVKKIPARKAVTPKPKDKGAPSVSRAARKTSVDLLPYLRFLPSRDLHGRLVVLLDRIKSSSDATQHRAKLSESVSELTEAGLDYYFVRTLKEAKVGFITQQSANIGLIGVKQVMTPVIRNVVGRLEHAQIQAIAKSIRGFMK